VRHLRTDGELTGRPAMEMSFPAAGRGSPRPCPSRWSRSALGVITATQVGHRTPAELVMVRPSEGSARLGCGGWLLAGVAQLVFMLCSLGWFVFAAGYGGRCIST
jgi:hypothetical protein